MDTDSFVLTINTKDIIKDLKNSEDIFDFSNLDKNHELFSNKNKKVVGKFKLETPVNIWVDEFVCLRIKMYLSKCGNDNRNKLKGVSKSQSKNIKFGEFKICLDGEENENVCSIYISKSNNHEMYYKNNFIYSR